MGNAYDNLVADVGRPPDRIRHREVHPGWFRAVPVWRVPAGREEISMDEYFMLGSQWTPAEIARAEIARIKPPPGFEFEPGQEIKFNKPGAVIYMREIDGTAVGINRILFCE